MIFQSWVCGLETTHSLNQFSDQFGDVTPSKKSSYSIQESGYISPFSTNLCQQWSNAPQTRGQLAKVMAIAVGQDFILFVDFILLYISTKQLVWV